MSVPSILAKLSIPSMLSILPVTPKSVPPKTGPWGPILAENWSLNHRFATTTDPPDQFWLPILVPLAKISPLRGPNLAKVSAKIGPAVPIYLICQNRSPC